MGEQHTGSIISMAFARRFSTSRPCGMKVIAFISGPLKLKSALARQQAFLRSMREIGLEADTALMVEGDHTMEGGMAAFAKLLAHRAPPTAVICSNDMTAIGVMRKSHEAQIAIPLDLSVIGLTIYGLHNS